jgi:hypothetical protein
VQNRNYIRSKWNKSRMEDSDCNEENREREQRKHKDVHLQSNGHGNVAVQV